MEYNFSKPTSLRDCFYMDYDEEYLPVPESFFKKFFLYKYNCRFSMYYNMRLAQYFYLKEEFSRFKYLKRFYKLLSMYFKRQNEMKNGFYCSINPKFEKNIFFHGPNLIITSETILRSGVHLSSFITFGMKNGDTPIVEKNVFIGANSVVMGGIIIGENSIIGAGSVVVKDIPPNSIAVGNPAIKIKNRDNQRF
jgi:acetyltransferase-like isoleucine patch superfamily enzyme